MKSILTPIYLASSLLLFSALAHAQTTANSRHSSNPAETDRALAFNGATSIVTIPDPNKHFDLDDFTIEAWVYRLSRDTYDVIVVKGGWGEDPTVDTNFALDITNTNVARVLWERSDSENFEVMGTTDIETNKWYHLAGVRSAAANTLALFVNGVKEGEVDTEGTPNHQALPVLLGWNGDGFPIDHHFDGYIDEVRIWRCPRTAEEIAATMLRRLHGNEPALTGYWTFDSDDGQIVIDSSPFANHGVLGKTTAIEPEDPTYIESDLELNAPLPPGPAGYALAFNGVSNIATIPDANKHFDLDDFTIEAWVYRLSRDTYDVIAVKGGWGEDPTVNTNFALDITNTNVARVLWERTDSENFEVWGETEIKPKNWYHLAGVRNAAENTLTLYVNGISEGTISTAGKPNLQDLPVILGWNGVGFPIDHHFDGYIDEVRIWRIPRSEGEIHTAMNFRIEPKIHGLAGYWRFDEGEGQTIFDLTPNGNHGYRGETPNPDDADPVWILSTAPINPGPPVPIELIAFEAAASAHGIILTWSTASEYRNAGFHIYRAAAAEAAGATPNYQQITTDMIPGAGTTSQSNDYQWLDTSVEANHTYHYRLAEIDFDGTVAFHGPISARFDRLPTAFQLHQNYPNPFNPTTTITYDLPVASEVIIEVFRPDGALVQTLARGIEPAGTHRLTWQFDGASGVYFYRLRARTVGSPQREIVQTRRLILLR